MPSLAPSTRALSRVIQLTAPSSAIVEECGLTVCITTKPVWQGWVKLDQLTQCDTCLMSAVLHVPVGLLLRVAWEKLVDRELNWRTLWALSGRSSSASLLG
jgi:hypothetical protein